MSTAGEPVPSQHGVPGPAGTTNLAEILERVLDKGIVIAGDIRINLLDIELLTIKLRLIVASVDKAREMGIDWWEHDPTLSKSAGRDALEQRLERIESAVGLASADAKEQELGSSGSQHGSEG
jgi:hypothetical protein